MIGSNTTASGPYAQAAYIYRKTGWRGVLPVGHRAAQKFPPPGDRFRSWTGHGAPDPSDADIAAWVETHGDRNIALRLPPGVIGLDVDAYGSKTGAATLAGLVERFGPLPATWITGARTDGVSGIRLYRVPLELDGAPINWPGEAGPNIEIIQHGHRYAIVWPSVNPEADGATYRWRFEVGNIDYAGDDTPSPDDLPDLPESWVRGLALDRARVDKADLGRGELAAWWAQLRDGEPCAPVHKVWTEAVRSISSTAGSRHERARDAASALARYGGEGHAGVPGALAQLGSAFERAVGAERATNGEWRRLLTGAVKLAAASHPTPRPRCTCALDTVGFNPGFVPDFLLPAGGTAPAATGATEAPAGELTLPKDFWEARPSLARLRQAAHSRVRSADVVFYGTLVRLAAMAPHWLVIDTGVGARGGANLYAAIVGPSGAGKSSGLGVARDLFPAPEGLEEFPLGSGEGIAEAFMGTESVETGEMTASGAAKKEKRRMQVRHNVLMHADEGASLNKMLERQGSTVGEALRSGWSNETLGQRNGRDETTRLVHGGNYSLGLLIGYQPETVGPLLDDVAKGTPQRFLYGWATDPSIPDEPVEWPGVGRNPFPPEVRSTAPAGDSPFGSPSGPDRTPVTFSSKILAGLRAEALARSRGEVVIDPYHSQRPMMHVKVSFLVAALDDGRRAVSDEDWELAECVLDTSDKVREYLIERARDAAAQAWARDTEALTARALHTHAAVKAHEESAEDRATARVAAALARVVHASEMQAVHRAVLRRALPSRDRARYDEAIARARDLAWVIGDDSAGWTPGPSMPA